jgi:hypothetical protein
MLLSVISKMRTLTQTPVRTVTRSKGSWVASIGADIITLILGLAICASVKLVGTIPGTEVVLIPLVPFLLIVRFKKVTQGKFKYLFLLLGLWLLGQIATDVYRGTGFVDWAKGDSAIIFMAMDLAGLAALVSGSERRKGLFIFSFSAGSLLATRVSPNYFFEGAPWKFGYGSGITALVVFASCFFFAQRKYAATGMLLLGIAGLNLLLDFRSPVLILLVTIGLVIPVIPERIGRMRILPAPGTGLRLVALSMILLATGMIAKIVITELAAAGALGEDAREKNELQQNSALGLLLGGRPEILVSSRAVIDSPILGHGSFGKDVKYTEMYRDLLVESGMHEDEFDEENENAFGRIPTHSHLMGAWVFAGVFGGLFWGYVLVLVVRGVIRATIVQPTLLPSYCYFCVSFIWDILFSPFGYSERVAEAFLLVVVCDLLNASPVPVARSVPFGRARRMGSFPSKGWRNVSPGRR